MIEIGSKDLLFFLAIAIAAISLIAIGFTYLRWNRLKLILFALRVLAILGVLILLGDIRWKKISATANRPLYLLVDSSKSMADEGASLKKVLQTLSSWSQLHAVEIKPYSFASKLSSAKSIPQILNTNFTEEESAIGESLRQLQREAKPGSRVLLLTDGVETKEWDPPQTDFRVNAISFGGELASDVAIDEVRFPGVIFARGEAPFKVSLRYPAGLKDTANLTLRDKATQEVIWQSSWTLSGISPEEIPFTMKAPKLTGTKTFELEVRPFPWETVTANNRSVFTTDILREKLRILYLCGKPTFDYAYLREFLRSSPANELVSFVILRNPEDVPPFGESELSLIPFPAHEIFSSSLGEFDLFILHDFSLARFALPIVYMDYIREFVSKGGGLIFLAGENTARASEYNLRPLAGSQGGFLETVFGVSPIPLKEGLTSGGLLYSKLSRLTISDKEFWNRTFPYEIDPQKNLTAWESILKLVHFFEPMAWISAKGRPSGAKTTMVAQMEAPSDSTAKTYYPSIITSELGRGRAILIGFVGSWLWKSGASLQSDLPDLYDHFWEGVLTWVTQGDPGKNAMKATLVFEGGKAKIAVKLNPKKISLTILPESLQVKLLPLGHTLILHQKSPGSALYEGAVQESGNLAYKRVLAQLNGQNIETNLATQKLSSQEMRMSMDSNYLKSLVEKNSGRLLGSAAEWTKEAPPDKAAALAEFLKEADLQTAGDTEEGPLPKKNFLKGPWVGILAALALLSEWFLRRYKGIGS